MVVKGLPENNRAILPDRFLKFSCEAPGKHLNGSSLLVCGKDGQWDKPFPTCEGGNGEHCRRKAQCMSDEAKSVMLLLHKSLLYVPDVTCEAEEMHHSLRAWGLPRDSEKMKIGHKLQFDCVNGLVLDGRRELTCSEDGKWDAPFPTCSGMFMGF